MSDTGTSSQSALALAALGVVFGDIGTSPLYAVKETFTAHDLVLNQANILGILSLIFWSLMLVVSLKYVSVMMRADNKGEGGILALLALAESHAPIESRIRKVLVVLGLLGAALFFGDSLITPAISVLSAVEGLEVGTDILRPAIVPIALVILLGLFVIQRRGTATIGKLFGPVMLLWFGALCVLGITNIAHHPVVLKALMPIHGIYFFVQHGATGFFVLGSVVLAITGAEALYADMGHFGRRPIQRVWFGYVLPALVINYFGQGALLLAAPSALKNPFYLMAPRLFLYPLIALATLATIIASQAVITGAFSVSRQIILMGYAPRLTIRHTSASEAGQIYIPFVNWALLIGVVILVLGFESSSNLAAAYGIAVTGTFAISTVLMTVVMRVRWNLSLPVTLVGMLGFLSIELAFFAANAPKIPEGGWLPLALGVVLFVLMLTWKHGREIVSEHLSDDAIPLVEFVPAILSSPPVRVPGTAVYMTSEHSGVPSALLHNLKHNKVLHERVLIVNISFPGIPYVKPASRLDIEEIGQNFYRVIIRYGFMDEIDVPLDLLRCRCGATLDIDDTTFFFSRENIVPSHGDGIMMWREHLFAVMVRNAASPMAFFRIPPDRVVDMGAQLPI